MPAIFENGSGKQILDSFLQTKKVVKIHLKTLFYFVVSDLPIVNTQSVLTQSNVCT